MIPANAASRLDGPVTDADPIPEIASESSARGRRRLGGLVAFCRSDRAANTYRSALAVAMALVSITAAGLALRTALIASEAAHLDSAALQESVERQRREQFLALVVDQDSRLFATYAQVYASQAASLAALESTTDPAERDALQLQIKADADLLNATFPLFQAVRPDVIDGELTFQPADVLAQILATDARLQELRSERSLARADQLHRAALTLVADVVVLVAALLLLTVAQVTRRMLATVSAAIGLVCAVGVIGLVAATDPNALVRLVLIIELVAFIPIAIVTGLLVWRGAPVASVEGAIRPTPDDVMAALESLQQARSLTEDMPTPDPSIGDPRRLDTPFARRVAVLIGTATLLAAVAGWLQASAFRNSDVAAGNAEEHAIEATAATQRDVGAAEAKIDRVTRYLLATVNAASARLNAAWYQQGDRDADAAASAREADRWESLAASDAESATLAASEFGPSGYGPDAGGDPRFPAQYLLQAQFDALVAVGLADADNRTSAAWAGQGSTYTGVLAVLAVALYLLGLSVIFPAPGIRRAFVGMATVAMASVVLVGALQILQRPADPDAPSDGDKMAAEQFAAGDIAMSRAQADPNRREDYARAARAFRDAIDLRPDFALARQDLATVLIQLGTRQTTGYPTVIDASACAEATTELHEARGLAVESALTAWNLGYCAYRQGIATNDRAMLSTAESELSEAIRLLPDQGVLYANLGAARLAMGDITGAREAYQRGVDPMNYLTIAGRVPRPSRERELIVAAALSELDTIGRWRGDLKPEVDALKEFVVSATLPDGTQTSLRIEGLEAYTVGGILGWQAHFDGREATGATLSMQWYRRDEAADEWYVLPEISGEATLGGTRGLAFLGSSADPTLFFSEVSFPRLFSPPRCLEAGSYRIELYAGGTFASATLDVTGTEDVAEYDRLLGAAFCRPADWREAEATHGQHSAFRSDDGSRGIVVLRARVPAIDQAGLPDFLELALRREADLFPGTPIPAPQGGDVFNGNWFIERNIEGLPAVDGYLSLDGRPGRLMFARARIDNSGSVVIVGVFGPDEGFAVSREGLLAVLDTVTFLR